ncbi:MAG: TPM domain-containing protein [Acidimicrobiales bacterium]
MGFGRSVGRLAVVTGVLVVARPAVAQVPPVPVPSPPSPSAGSYVVDEPDSLTGDTESLITQLATAWQQQTTNQLGVAVVATTGGRSIDEYSLELANAWAAATDAFDNGVILVLAVEDRALRIEVSDGLTTRLPDDTAQAIIDRSLPVLAAGDIDGAVLQIVREVRDAIDQGPSVPGGASTSSPESAVSDFADDEADPPSLAWLWVVASVVVLIVLISRSARSGEDDEFDDGDGDGWTSSSYRRRSSHRSLFGGLRSSSRSRSSSGGRRSRGGRRFSGRGASGRW